VLPITTETVWEGILRQRRAFDFVAVERDFVTIQRENPEVAAYIYSVWGTLRDRLRELGFSEDTARQLAIIGWDICVMMYISLRRQAELDWLPPLPRVSRALVDAFVERLDEYMLRPPHEVARALERNPRLLRNTWNSCVTYLAILEQFAREERVSPERLPAIAYTTFGFACGLYEMLGEAEEAEELARLARRR